MHLGDALGALGVEHFGDAVGQHVEGDKVHDGDGDGEEEVRAHEHGDEVLVVEPVHGARWHEDDLHALTVAHHLLVGARAGSSVAGGRLNVEDLSPRPRPAAHRGDLDLGVDVGVRDARLAVVVQVFVHDVDFELHACRAEVRHSLVVITLVLTHITVLGGEGVSLRVERDDILERHNNAIAALEPIRSDLSAEPFALDARAALEAAGLAGRCVDVLEDDSHFFHALDIVCLARRALALHTIRVQLPGGVAFGGAIDMEGATISNHCIAACLFAQSVRVGSPARPRELDRLDDRGGERDCSDTLRHHFLGIEGTAGRLLVVVAIREDVVVIGARAVRNCTILQCESACEVIRSLSIGVDPASRHLGVRPSVPVKNIDGDEDEDGQLQQFE